MNTGKQSINTAMTEEGSTIRTYEIFLNEELTVPTGETKGPMEQPENSETDSQDVEA